MHRIHLSRRNLLALLSKLDAGRVQATIIKNDPTNRDYPSTTATLVTAVEDHLYYAHSRPDPPGMVALEAQPKPAPPTSGSTSVSKRRRKT